MASKNLHYSSSLVKEQQRSLLAESLAALRAPGKADIVLVANGYEFYAHKLVLEAVSPYFVTMFNNQQADYTLGKIVFNELKSETLGAVLDFIYLGETDNIQSQDQIINTLQASRIMQMKALRKYCCNQLLQILSLDNLLGIWAIARYNEAEEMLSEVLNYIVQNLSAVLNKNAFLLITADQVKGLLNHTNDKLTNSDALLFGLFNWLKYDLRERSIFTADLLASVNAKGISAQCLKSILKDPSNYDIIQSNFLQFERFSVGCSDGPDSTEANIESASVDQDKTIEIKPESNEKFPLKEYANHSGSNGKKITFFVQHANEATNTNENCSGESKIVTSKVQQFDLGSMSWLPSVTMPNNFQYEVEALCQFDQHLCMIGTELGDRYVLYDFKENAVEFVSCAYNVSRENAAFCYFKGCLFLLGGNSKNGKSTAAVHYVPTNRKKSWCATSPLNYCHSNPVTLLSENTLYVTGQNDLNQGKLIVECTTGPQLHSTDNKYTMSWVTIDINHAVNGLRAHLFLSNNKLRCLHVIERELQKLVQNSKWHAQGLPPPDGFELIKSVLHFSGNKSDLLYVSTVDDKLGIPSFTHKLNSSHWNKLPDVKGECDIAHYGNIRTLNTMGI